jgi:hypothetical protein
MNDPTYDGKEIERNPVWKLAFFLSELFNDNAPLDWSKYIPIAQDAIDKARVE